MSKDKTRSESWEAVVTRKENKRELFLSCMTGYCIRKTQNKNRSSQLKIHFFSRDGPSHVHSTADIFPSL